MKFTVTNGAYYVPNPALPPQIYVMSGYNFTNRTYDQRNGARFGGIGAPGSPTPPIFNPNFGVDGLYFYLINTAGALPDGTTVIMFVLTRIAINVGTDAFQVSLENLRVYGGGGPGIIQGPHDQGLRISNVVIDRKPDVLLSPGEQPRYVSLFGDSDSNSTRGDIIIENSIFGLIDDDTWFARSLRCSSYRR